MSTPEKFTEQELRVFLSTRKVIVVCEQLGSARSIRQLLIQLGAKADNALALDQFLQARNELEAQATHILISDLFIDGREGLELINSQEKKFLNRLDVASIMVCSDPNGVSTGMMAEADVDGVLLKPFNIESFRTVIYQALENKVKPSSYWKFLETGKEHFNKNEFELATPIFESAKKADPSPTLAFFYLGLIAQAKNELGLALQCFEDGLAFDPKNFRCLFAVFDLKMKNAEYEQAYEIATLIHQHYPVSTKRILDLVKLSIYTKKYIDILDYYEIFKKTEKRDPALSRVVVAGMLICVKHFVLKSQKAKALEILQDAAKIAMESETLRSEVLRYFVESGNFTEGEQYFALLPEEFQAQPEVRALQLELAHASDQSGLVIHLGNGLIKDKLQTVGLFRLMIENSIKLNRSEQRIKDLINEARMYFPKDFKD